MFRESLAPGAAHAFVLASAAKDSAVPIGTVAGAPAPVAERSRRTRPENPTRASLRMTRNGDTFYGYIATDTGPWQYMGKQMWRCSPTVYVGIAVPATTPCGQRGGSYNNHSPCGGSH